MPIFLCTGISGPWGDAAVPDGEGTLGAGPGGAQPRAGGRGLHPPPTTVHHHASHRAQRQEIFRGSSGLPRPLSKGIRWLKLLYIYIYKKIWFSDILIMHIASAIDPIPIRTESGFSGSGFGIRILLRIHEEQHDLLKRKFFVLNSWVGFLRMQPLLWIRSPIRIGSGFRWDSGSGFRIRILLRIQEEQDGLRKKREKIIFF